MQGYMPIDRFGYTACVFRKRWLGALMGIVLLASLYFYVGHAVRTGKLLVQPAKLTLPADGRWHAVLQIRIANGRSLSLSEMRTSGANIQLLQNGAAQIQGQLRSPVMPGKEIMRLMWKRQTVSVPVNYVSDFTDSFGDGTPDFLRLHSGEDRQAFRAWFAAVAEAQAELPKDQLPAEIDDCAALLRYSYRQALHAHDEPWLQSQHLEALEAYVSIHQYQYPLTPLGAALFRVTKGPFVPDDIGNGSFTQFADAKALMQWNTHFISRDVRVAQMGDLIFFRQLEQNSPYHSMVITDKDAAWVVYHTGPIGKSKGEMRRVAMDDLLHHPDVRWRPVPENSNFLGVYRWNILRNEN
jgi:uncharacterized protein